MLDNKVIVVTGGAGLLGAEFAKAIADNHGTVIIADIDPKKGGSLQRDITNKSNAVAEFVAMNINDKLSIQNTITDLITKYGKIDALVNTAYPRNNHYGRKMMEVGYEDFCENINLNLGGYFLTSQLFSAQFLAQGYGNIINIASIYGVIAPKFEIYAETEMTMPVEYAVIKSGIIHLTKYFAKFFKGKNIRVNALSPGGIFDSQQRAFLDAYQKACLNKGMLDKKDLVGSLLFLLSDHSLFINGQNLIVDDGFTL